MTTITEFLAEQKRLAEDATPGPWHEDRFTNGLITACGRVDAHGDQLAVAESVYMLGDREFIAAARSSVPRMIAALEAVMEALALGDELERTENEYLDPLARRLQIQNRILNRIEQGIEAALLGGEGDA